MRKILVGLIFAAVASAAWAQWGGLYTGRGAGSGSITGGTCTNQFARAIDTAGAVTCESVVAADISTMPAVYCVAASDETTALTTGTAKVTFRMPFAMTLTAVRGSVTTAATGATLLTVDVNEGGATILSTKLTFDASETTTTTAATAAVISDSALADDAQMTIDIDNVGSTVAGAGLKVCLIGTR